LQNYEVTPQSSPDLLLFQTNAEEVREASFVSEQGDTPVFRVVVLVLFRSVYPAKPGLKHYRASLDYGLASGLMFAVGRKRHKLVRSTRQQDVALT